LFCEVIHDASDLHAAFSGVRPARIRIRAAQNFISEMTQASVHVRFDSSWTDLDPRDLSEVRQMIVSNR
jgi:hypothetical protein